MAILKFSPGKNFYKYGQYNALVNGMPQYPPPGPSRGILGDLTMIISIAPGSEQYQKSNPLFSILGNMGDLIAFMLLLL